MNHVQITVPIAIFNIILTILSVILCTFSIYRFKYAVKKQISTPSQKKAADRELRYFQVTSQLSSICNVGCCLSVSLYSLWIIWEPQQRLEWFIALRALPTCFWFVAKASLIWLYNGRLYFAFKKAIFETPYCRFLFVNILIAVAVPTLIVCGYVGVWYGQYPLIATGFQGYRFLFMLLTFYLLFAFSRKMLLLHQYEKSRSSRLSRKMVSITPTSSQGAHAVDGTATATQQKPIPAETLIPEKEMSAFIRTATKNAVLVLFISVSAVGVAFCWICFDYIIVKKNSVALSLPMTMFAVDSVVDSICIFMLFIYGQSVYDKWCPAMDSCCKKILICLTRSDADDDRDEEEEEQKETADHIEHALQKSSDENRAEVAVNTADAVVEV